MAERVALVTGGGGIGLGIARASRCCRLCDDAVARGVGRRSDRHGPPASRATRSDILRAI